jgi:hypothetical protein
VTSRQLPVAASFTVIKASRMLFPGNANLHSAWVQA